MQDFRRENYDKIEQERAYLSIQTRCSYLGVELSGQLIRDVGGEESLPRIHNKAPT